MSLAARLPDRPLRFAETMRAKAVGDLDVVGPLLAVSVGVTARDDELVVGGLLREGEPAELAGYDPAARSWGSVAVSPDLTEYRGVVASHDGLEARLVEKDAVGDLVPITVDVNRRLQ